MGGRVTEHVLDFDGSLSEEIIGTRALGVFGPGTVYVCVGFNADKAYYEEVTD